MPWDLEKFRALPHIGSGTWKNFDPLPLYLIWDLKIEEFFSEFTFIGYTTGSKTEFGCVLLLRNIFPKGDLSWSFFLLTLDDYSLDNFVLEIITVVRKNKVQFYQEHVHNLF